MKHLLHRALSIRTLKIISVLGAELSLSKCAELLHTTQPSISRALAQAESLLDVRLFERSTRRMSATSAGLSLIHHANRILAELDVAEEELTGLRGRVDTEVRIGVLPVFSPTRVATAVTKARSAYPNARFVITSGPLDALYTELLAGRIDVMLSHAEISVDLNLVEVVQIYEDWSCIVAAPGHRLAKRKRLSWEDVANEPWVLPSLDSPARPKIDRMLSVYRSAGQSYGSDAQTNSADIAIRLVREGMMLWAVASAHAKEYAAAGLVKPIAMPGELVRGPMCYFRLRKEALKIPERSLLRFLRNAA